MKIIMTHELKCWPIFYQDLINGNKKFELRKNDRDYQVGHILHISEYDIDHGLTGKSSHYTVVSIMHGPVLGLQKGYCIMSVKKLNW